MKTICQLAEVKPSGYQGIRHRVATTFYQMAKSLGFLQRYLRHQHPTTTGSYLRSLEIEDIRKGVDDLMLPTFKELITDQGQLIGNEFEQVLKPGDGKADVVLLDDARKTRESV
jgi:hypothetical protein